MRATAVVLIEPAHSSQTSTASQFVLEIVWNTPSHVSRLPPLLLHLAAHGYPVGWVAVPVGIRKQWLDAGRVRRRDIQRNWD